MAAAKKVFARNGFHATTIVDIAKEAELANGSIYWYFDSKDHLFRSLIAAEEFALRTHVAVALAESGTSFGYAKEPFRATLRATLEFFEADRATTKLLFRDAYALDNGFNQQLSGIYERFIDDIETLIVAAQQRGEVVTAPPRLVAYTVASLIGYLAHRRLTTDEGRFRGRSRRFRGLAGHQRIAARRALTCRRHLALRAAPDDHEVITAGQRPNAVQKVHRRGELTQAHCSGIIDGVSTSLGEASTRIQATDPERRETPRVRTAPPGLRVEPKWLPESPDTPCFAETLTSGVRLSR